jgi:YidC/Oxa1 family membrane protein insertase
MFNLLAVLYAFVHDFGLAIILLTVVIRLLLWPLVTKQLHSQKALQELQPELQRIKAQANGDRQLEGQLTMELYKEREINPSPHSYRSLSSCPSSLRCLSCCATL